MLTSKYCLSTNDFRSLLWLKIPTTRHLKILKYLKLAELFGNIIIPDLKIMPNIKRCRLEMLFVSVFKI